MGYYVDDYCELLNKCSWFIPSSLYLTQFQTGLLVVGVGLALVYFTLLAPQRYYDGLPVVNRRFSFEPHLFSRLRWAGSAKSILENADAKYQGQPYRLAKGDVDVVILPARCVSELNRQPTTVLSSQESQSDILVGHLTGMDVVKRTAIHVKILLSRISPQLSQFVEPVRWRVQESLEKDLPRTPGLWTEIDPVQAAVHLVSRSNAYVLLGSPICDEPHLYEKLTKYTEDVFTVAFLMRLVPSFLQPLFVWLLPFKWSLERTSKFLGDDIVYPEIRRRLEKGRDSSRKDLLDYMMRANENFDRRTLKLIIGALAAGGTYSTASLITSVIRDLVVNPEDMEEIREEIRMKQAEIGGNWDMKALDGLEKLESVMKESARYKPASLILYSRRMMQDYQLSEGTTLKKGQYIGISGHFHANNPNIFENPEKFDALRAYRRDLEEHRTYTFSKTPADDYRWGAGRWACPGRFVATMVTKLALVKLLDEYEFAFPNNKPPRVWTFHEFPFWEPGARFLVKKREINSGIKY